MTVVSKRRGNCPCRINQQTSTLHEADKASNEDALKTGSRILSAYTDSKNTRFWIITEADRSVTTVLLPDDY